MASYDATDTSGGTTATTPKTRQSMPDSAGLTPVSGRSRSKGAFRARPVWSAYSIARVKYTAPPTSQPTTPMNSGTSDVRDNNGKPRRNRHKRQNNGDNTEDTAVNAGFSGSKSGQRKKPFKKMKSGIVQSGPHT